VPTGSRIVALTEREVRRELGAANPHLCGPGRLPWETMRIAILLLKVYLAPVILLSASALLEAALAWLQGLHPVGGRGGRLRFQVRIAFGWPVFVVFAVGSASKALLSAWRGRR
jgi:hypothetical protein